MSIYNENESAVSNSQEITVDNTSNESNDYPFEPLLTVDEAGDKLEQIIHSFFRNDKSIFINVSTGFGKTKTALKILKQVPWQKKVLYLVSSHKLAEDIMRKFKIYWKPVQDASVFASYRREERRIGNVKYLRGKEALCGDPVIRDNYKAQGVPIPTQQCLNCTKYRVSGCGYIEQFNSLSNVRIMSHDEYRNDHQAAFFGGSDGEDGAKPRKGGWKVDYIIVDEDWLKHNNRTASMDSHFDSIRRIINQVIEGSTLQEAVRQFSNDVLSDYDLAKSIQHPVFKDPDQYILDIKKKNAQLANYDFLLAFSEFLKTGDETELSRMKLHNKKLQYFRMKKVASRYDNVPTLFLDATANETIVKTVISGIDFHSLKIRANEKVNIHQAKTFNISKTSLEDPSTRKGLVDLLKELGAQYEKIGLITYKNIKGVHDFHQWLSDQTGIALNGYFGNIRGVDDFEEVDCLVIAGMHFIPLHEIENYAIAIFGEQCDPSWEWTAAPVRMKDGSIETVQNRRYKDDNLEMVKQHYCTAETIQAIGRARLIWGAKEKDIYVLSKESLGGDIEITDFIASETGSKGEKYADAINVLAEIGYCQNKPNQLTELGLKKSWIKNDHDGIEKAFMEAEVEKITISSTDKHRNTKVRDYYVSDRAKFNAYVAEIGGTVVNLA